MPTSKLTLQQQQQLLHAACLAVLNSPDTVYPVIFTPFERFVSKATKVANNLVYFLLALVIIWFSLFISLNSFILLVVALGLVNIYSSPGNAIRNTARWYWYECADNHEGVRGSNQVPSININMDNSCYCSTLGVEDDAGLLSKSDIDGYCYCSSLEGEDAGSHNSDANDHYCCSTLGEKDDAGDIGRDTYCYCSSLDGEDAGSIAKGDGDIVVGVDNVTHVPRDADLGDVHGANDINLVVGVKIGSADTNLLVLSAGISGDIKPALLETKFLSPPNEMEYDTVPVFDPFVELENECGGNDTSFSYFKNTSRVQDSVRRSRLRVRHFVRSRPGVSCCASLRPLRSSGDSSFRCSSSLVGYIGVDSFDESDKMADFCEPMDIDSFEEMSDRGDEQELAVGNFGSFSFGYVPTLKEGSFEPVVTGAGSPVISIPCSPSFGVLSPPSCGVILPPSTGVFLREPVPSDCVPTMGTKFEATVSEERGLTPLLLPDLVVPEVDIFAELEDFPNLAQAMATTTTTTAATTITTTATTTTTTATTAKEGSKKSFLDALFDDAEEEEEEEEMELQKENKRNKK